MFWSHKTGKYLDVLLWGISQGCLTSPQLILPALSHAATHTVENNTVPCSPPSGPQRGEDVVLRLQSGKRVSGVCYFCCPIASTRSYLHAGCLLCNSGKLWGSALRMVGRARRLLQAPSLWSLVSTASVSHSTRKRGARRVPWACWDSRSQLLVICTSCWSSGPSGGHMLFMLVTNLLLESSEDISEKTALSIQIWSKIFSVVFLSELVYLYGGSKCKFVHFQYFICIDFE